MKALQLAPAWQATFTGKTPRILVKESCLLSSCGLSVSRGNAFDDRRFCFPPFEIQMLRRSFKTSEHEDDREEIEQASTIVKSFLFFINNCQTTKEYVDASHIPVTNHFFERRWTFFVVLFLPALSMLQMCFPLIQTVASMKNIRRIEQFLGPFSREGKTIEACPSRPVFYHLWWTFGALFTFPLGQTNSPFPRQFQAVNSEQKMPDIEPPLPTEKLSIFQG